MKKQLNRNRLILCGKIDEVMAMLRLYAWLYEGYTVKKMFDEMNSVEQIKIFGEQNR